MSAKPPPPRPEAKGLTTPRAKVAAQAASTALPPAFRISTPAADAARESEATAACLACKNGADTLAAVPAKAEEGASADQKSAMTARKVRRRPRKLAHSRRISI